VHRPEPAEGRVIALLLGGALGMAALVGVHVTLGWSLSPLTWYIARSSGLILYLLTWFIVVSGLGLTTKLIAWLGGRGTTFSVHGYAFHLWYGFLLLHLLSLALDPTVAFGPKELFVPFLAGWREPWTGMGVLAAEVGVIVGGSFGLRRVIGYRAWRALHWLSFPVFLGALAHGLGAGTDASSPVVFGVYVATGASVLVMTFYRALRHGTRERPPPAPAPVPFDRMSPAIATTQVRARRPVAQLSGPRRETGAPAPHAPAQTRPSRDTQRTPARRTRTYHDAPMAP
jgi:hypothetical protein